VDQTVLANERGAGFKNSRGVAIYWPRNDAFYAVDYGGVTAVPAWNDFLNSYHTVGMAELPPPQINLSNVLSQTAGVQSPAYLDFEIVGRDIANVALIGGRYQEDGRRRLLEYDNLIPEPAALPGGPELVA
jgi:hypothetical protein